MGGGEGERRARDEEEMWKKLEQQERDEGLVAGCEGGGQWEPSTQQQDVAGNDGPAESTPTEALNRLRRFWVSGDTLSHKTCSPTQKPRPLTAIAV